jgi:DNA primase small subunit
MFREYYTKNSSLSNIPSLIEKREFGFASFNGWMLRHRHFKVKEELTVFLQNFVPSDAYFSCAYYEDPEAEMEKKGWSGADLIFDIDADHIPTPCRKIHDEWKCGNCGFSGKGVTPEKCPNCNGEKFDARTWPCDVCLDTTKHEVTKLLDMMMQDFGFSKKEMHVFFSGHRGYHVHLENESIKSLDTIARKEIVDYIIGLGFDDVLIGLESGKLLRGPDMNDFGWRGRVAKALYAVILNGTEEDFKSVGLKENVIGVVIKNRDALLKSLKVAGSWSAVKGVGLETWKKLVEFSVQSYSARVDTVVTTDVHRLIRLADTLHGKTGLKKMEVALSALEDFDPFKSATAFKAGVARVFVSDAPEFRIGDETFGPYKNQEAELPTAAAVLLVCKGRAEVLE